MAYPQNTLGDTTMTSPKLPQQPKWRPHAGIGKAGFYSNYCRATRADGKPCGQQALHGGYYCKAHTPK